ncbi:MAG TPA: asparagine synthase (glutamine-hydrolyzing) [Thermoanaerobaculia bacterium]|nr:asparagine synthase (glutamine-hydrolyzing) [Thermoanaerobaculia bacterium]
MCGINGIVSFRAEAPLVDRDELLRTREAMRARGPDATGIWMSDDGRTGLGHRRLSIIDVSDRANQPMVSRDGRLVLTFNGEIYNFAELRAELERESETFDTNSDTEVVLRMYAKRGTAMLSRLRGMFALAIWDSRDRTLLLARDPYGIKSLYYAYDGATFRFASQVKALLAGGNLSSARDPAGVVGFLLRGHVPEPFTIYESIRELPAGSSMIVTSEGAPAPRSYFSIATILRDAVNEDRRFRDGEREAVIAEGVRESVRDHLVSDVPVGAFLSAGRDSGTIVALAAENRPLPTITLSFDTHLGTQKDEAPMAALVARQYGCDHYASTLTGDAFRRELPRALEAMDQPSLDGLNSYFVCKAAAALGWKVALSGTGGDELFGGYSTFRIIPRVVRMFAAFRHMPRVADAFARVHLLRSARFSPKTAYTLKYCTSYEGAYLMKRGLFLPDDVASVVGDEMAREGLKRLGMLDLIREVITPDPGTPFARVMALESSLLLRSQLLRDIDWASMAHSLEVRVPLADAFLLRKIAPAILASGNGKDLLAASPRQPLPPAILNRKKSGFTVPIRTWLGHDRDAKKQFGGRPWAIYVLETGGHLPSSPA